MNLDQDTVLLRTFLGNVLKTTFSAACFTSERNRYEAYKQLRKLEV